MNKYFYIKIITNLKKFFSQHDFFQYLITIYKQNYNIQIINFELKLLK